MTFGNIWFSIVIISIFVVNCLMLTQGCEGSVDPNTASDADSDTVSDSDSDSDTVSDWAMEADLGLGLP
ncbi:MAG: hypothetical protein GY847_27505 [Proteobacteria bacterium]|nr:hypothetical protein [Pseudomonadota bacterium]